MNIYRIGFTYNINPAALLIRLFTGGPSHSYVVKSGPEGEFVLEAVEEGVVVHPYAEFAAKQPLRITEFVVDPQAGKLNSAWELVKKHRVGRPYAFWQIPGDAIVILGEALTGKHISRNPFTQAKADVCSEIVLAWLRRADMNEGFEHLHASTVSPRDLLGIITQDPRFTRFAPPK
jgi:hypothetical protein